MQIKFYLFDAVGINLNAPLDRPIAYHCNMCKKMTGYYLVSTDIPHGICHLVPLVRRSTPYFIAKSGSTLFLLQLLSLLDLHKNWCVVPANRSENPSPYLCKSKRGY